MKKKKKRDYCYKEGALSIIANVLLFALKYFAGVVSGSIALIADAWHTLSDSLSSLVLIVGRKIAKKPADKEHPFGHGRAELISSIFIGVLLALVSFSLLFKSIEKLQLKQTANYGLIAIIVTISSIIIKELLAQYAFSSYRKTKKIALKADAWHHQSDAISSVIVLIGLFLGKYFWWIDGVLGISVALLLAYASFKIFKETTSPLLGEAPSSDIIELVQKVCQENGSFKPHHIHIHKYGEHIELTFHLHFPGDMKISDAHLVATTIERILCDSYNIETTIHLESEKEIKD